MLKEFRNEFLPTKATFEEILPNHRCCTTREGKILAEALYRPQALIDTVDRCLPALEKVWETDDCLVLSGSGYCHDLRGLCLEENACQSTAVEHVVKINLPMRMLLSNCLGPEGPNIPELIHVIFARDPRNPEQRLQVSHYCCLRGSQICCHPTHFGLESAQVNKIRSTHQHGTVLCDCSETQDGNLCHINGENIKIIENGVHVGWTPRARWARGSD